MLSSKIKTDFIIFSPRKLIDLEKQKSDAVYITSYQIPQIKTLVSKCIYGIHQPQYEQTVDYYLKVIRNEVEKLEGQPKVSRKFSLKSDLSLEKFNQTVADSLNSFLGYVQNIYNQEINRLNMQLESRLDSLKNIFGKQWLIELKKNNYLQKKMTHKFGVRMA